MKKAPRANSKAHTLKPALGAFFNAQVKYKIVAKGGPSSSAEKILARRRLPGSEHKTGFQSLFQEVEAILSIHSSGRRKKKLTRKAYAHIYNNILCIIKSSTQEKPSYSILCTRYKLRGKEKQLMATAKKGGAKKAAKGGAKKAAAKKGAKKR